MSRRLSPPFLASTLATALLLAGCEAPSSSPGLSGLAADTGGKPSAAPARALLEPGCTARTFHQPISSGKLDLLFVTDTSGSLTAEREEIAEGIDHFIRALPEGHDIRIGVMLAHSPHSPHSGRLWRSDGGMIRGYERSEPWVLSTIDMPRGYVRAKLRQKLRWQASEYVSDGGEFGMGSLLSGLEPSRLAESRNKGFFRTDAALAVVFVSDENDLCAEYPAGVTPVFDPDGLEAPAKRRFCTAAAGITPERVLSRLQELQTGRPLVVGGILYADPSRVPRGLENEAGYGYLETLRLAGDNGLVVELADGHLDEGLGRLGEFTSQRLELQDSFPVDASAASHQVRIDGREVGFRISGSRIYPDEIGNEGSVIEILSCAGSGAGGCVRSSYDWDGGIPHQNDAAPGIPALPSGTGFADDEPTALQLCREATGPDGVVLSRRSRSWHSPHDNVIVRWNGREYGYFNARTYNRWLTGLKCGCVATPVPEPTSTPVPEPTSTPVPETPWDPIGIGI